MKRTALLAGLLIGVLSFGVFAGPDPRGILELIGYSNSDSSGITSYRTRGDFKEQVALATNDFLFFIKGYGYNGSALTSSPAARIVMAANQTWTTTANGTYIASAVTPNSSTTLTEATRTSNIGASVFRITPDLDITVTTPTLVGQLGITSAGVLYVSTSTTKTTDWIKVGAQ